MADRYSRFEELAAEHCPGIDYDIRVKDRGSPVVFLAPHGGWIEPHTAEIAEMLSGDDYSFYAFETLKKGPHGDFHITSSRFDEPQAVALVKRSNVAIAIHGRADNGDEVIWLGGRATELLARIGVALRDAGFMAEVNARLPGIDAENICNRTSQGRGVQLELPRALRETLSKNPKRLDAFCTAIRSSVRSSLAV